MVGFSFVLSALDQIQRLRELEAGTVATVPAPTDPHMMQVIQQAVSTAGHGAGWYARSVVERKYVRSMTQIVLIACMEFCCCDYF